MAASLQSKVRKFSEEEMSASFLKAISSRKGLPGIGSFWKVFQEVPCLRGRPDIIGLKRKARRPALRNTSPLGLCDATVLALLDPAAPRTIEELAAQAGFSGRSVRKSLVHLQEECLALRTRAGSYLSNPRRDFSDWEAWAFELKLKNVKRAIFQAQQYCLFAQRVFIVMPPEQKMRMLRHERILEHWGISAAVFDPYKRFFEIVKDANQRPPFSRRHEIYAISCAIHSA